MTPPTKTAESNHPTQEHDLAPAPSVTVRGQMNGNVALQLGWLPGIHPVSQSRLKFLKKELGVEVIDDPEQYMF